MKLDLDEYAYLDSPIHRWEPRCKLVGLMALVFAFASIEDLRLAPVMVGMTVLLYAASRLPVSFWLRRIRYPGYFLLGIVVLLPVLSGETVVWQWGWLALRREGLLAVVLITSRFVSILTVGFVLFGTTPFLITVRAMRSLGLPAILADMLLLSYRYLFEIAGNLAQMQRSMRLRGFQSRGNRWLIPNWQDLNRLASLSGTLFIRSYEQAERIYKAMRLRGYGAQTRAIAPIHRAKTPANQLWSGVGLAIALIVAISFAVAEVVV
ncbi:MAG: cobalt ECF transporter T component CbiQ [Leptolyngbyaceae cyanobacterium SL_7_1]|nr:cobalt ECF transporter T component CbiQ [Leptolyngbyaceae cyanobacterium SL_7_1]